MAYFVRFGGSSEGSACGAGVESNAVPRRAAPAGRRVAGAAAVLGACLLVAGCSEAFSYKDMPVAKGSAQTGAGNSVTMRGQSLQLAGTAIQVGSVLSDGQLAGADLSPVKLADSKGKVRIVSVVPSLDTPVCEQQTHYLSEKNEGLDASIQLITVSIDTPFAQSRFAKEAKISNVTFLSDYRAAEFGRSNGLLVEGPHLLARAVLVIDPENVIRYMQVTPELTELPDMKAAFEFARTLAKS
jgi:thioredoxin-dependent peroxiredoxin